MLHSFAFFANECVLASPQFVILSGAKDLLVTRAWFNFVIRSKANSD
jgi:hypothetical protein